MPEPTSTPSPSAKDGALLSGWALAAIVAVFVLWRLTRALKGGSAAQGPFMNVEVTVDDVDSTKDTFAPESRFAAAVDAHNGKNYAVVLPGHVSAIALFGYSDLAVEWRDERFPAADIVEITAVLPESAKLSDPSSAEGESEHARR